MEAYYQALAALLPEDERFEITYDQDCELINITTYDVMIPSDTAAKIFEYCSRHSLRCYIAWSCVKAQLLLGIFKNIP